MRGGTMFSGIGAPECAAPWIDWRWCSEIDPFPSAVHAARFPGVRNLSDMTKVGWDAVEPVDVVVWGSPCQAFSVAGRRAGLDDPRGDLTLVGLAALGRIRPRWMVWENVPGVLSIDGGRTFGTVLGLMGELGYGVAYRVLDAQYFGVAQRRRRVFVVGYFGDWRRAAAVLFECDSLSGNPAPSRESRKVAPTIPSRSTGGGGLGTDFDCDGGLIASVAPTLWRCAMKTPANDFNFDGGLVVHGTQDPCTSDKAFALGRNNGQENVVFSIQAGALRTNPLSGPDGVGIQANQAYTLEARAEVQAVAVSLRGRDGGSTAEIGDDIQNCLRASSGGGDKPHVLSNTQVRRLTPRECERLQGFPDGWTDIVHRGKPAADGPRYRALGNSMAVPVLAWLLDRIRQVDAIPAAMAAA